MTGAPGRARRRALPLIVTLLLAAGIAATAAPAAADGNEAPGAPASFRSISAGRDHSCGLLVNGTVRCWGSNDVGQLGQGDTDDRGGGAGELGGGVPPVLLGTGRTAVAIAAGATHTCALLDNSTVKCWGSSEFGEVGPSVDPVGDEPGEMGDALPAIQLGTGRTVSAITGGAGHTCALLDDGTVKCWGFNAFGQLGVGDEVNRGSAGTDMGDALPAVDLGTGRTATAVTAGDSFTCALLDDGGVKCWGVSAFGELGQGNLISSGGAEAPMGDGLPPIDLGTGRTATAISSGYSHTCAILDNATMKCWGEGFQGRLGVGNEQNRGDQPGEMGEALPAVALGGGRTPIGIAVGDDGTCALLDNRTVKCWGSGQFGQTGLGDAQNRGDQPGEMGDSLTPVPLGRPVTAVTAGEHHVCARLDNTQVKCWGRNTYGQLGIGSTESQGDEPGEMAALPSAIALRPVYRPDGLIARAGFALVGNNVYNTTAAGQTRSATVGPGGSAAFNVRLGNDGNVTDSLRIVGQATTSRFTVTYRRGPTNITAQVVAGTYTLANLPPGATRDITITIRSKAGTPVGTAVSRTVQARSGANGTIRDTVKATVTRR